MVLRVTGAVKTLIQRGILDSAMRPVGRDHLLPHGSVLVPVGYGAGDREGPYLASFQASWMSIIRAM